MTRDIRPASARRESFPRDLSPQLPTLVKDVPEGEGWLHEIKLDGYRVMAYLEDGEARLLTRGGQDWTDKLRPLAAALTGLVP